MTAPIPTIIADVDTGIDDMLALMYLSSLHRRGEITLAAVTTTAGNATVCQTANNSRWVLQLCGCPDVPVVAGAARPLVVPLTTTPETHGETGLGFARAPQMAGSDACTATTHGVREAWEMVLDAAAAGVSPSVAVSRATAGIDSASEAQADVGDDAEAQVEAKEPSAVGTNAEGAVDSTATPNVRLVVTGPLTNLAHHRDLIPRFESVTVMGGAVNYPGNTTEHAEWNFWVDPDAVRIVLEEYAQHTPHGVPPMTLCHLGVTETIIVDPSNIERWAIPGELGQLVHDALRFYFGFHTTVGLPYCAQVHDLFAVMLACGRVEASSHIGLLAADPEDRGAVIAVNGTAADSAAATATAVRIIDAVDPEVVRAEHERAFSIYAEA